MAFAKDLLLIDFESTGYIPETSDPIEIGALLLDKQTLQEKDSFSSLIYSDLKNIVPGSREMWKIDVSQIQSAPQLSEVAKKFVEKFGFDVLVGSWVQRLDRGLLNKMVAAGGFDPQKYDYHFMDLWPVAYLHLVKNGYTGPFDSDPMFNAFGFPLRGKHDALEDCRIEAEILRKIYNA